MPWTQPLKIKMPKIGIRHVLSWPKLGLESKFRGAGTFGGFGKGEQTDIHTILVFNKYRFFMIMSDRISIKMKGYTRNTILMTIDLFNGRSHQT